MRQFIVRILREIFMSDHYINGWDAFWRGEDEGDNPHIEGTYAFTQWEYGWTAAQDDLADNPQGVANYD